MPSIVLLAYGCEYSSNIFNSSSRMHLIKQYVSWPALSLGGSAKAYVMAYVIVE